MLESFVVVFKQFIVHEPLGQLTQCEMKHLHVQCTVDTVKDASMSVSEYAAQRLPCVAQCPDLMHVSFNERETHGCDRDMPVVDALRHARRFAQHSHTGYDGEEPVLFLRGAIERWLYRPLEGPVYERPLSATEIEAAKCELNKA